MVVSIKVIFIKMEDCANKRISMEGNLKFGSKTFNHHTSVQYGAEFFSKSGLVRRSSNLQSNHFDKIDKQEIFQLVFNFIQKLVTNSSAFNGIIGDLSFQASDKNISIQKIEVNCQSEKQNSNLSIGSSEALPEEGNQNSINAPIVNLKLVEQEKEKKKQARQPKISIMIDNFDDFSSSTGSKFSCNSIVNISHINFPPHKLTLKMVRRIFEEPEAFLINLALCLLLKFLFYSKIPMTNVNSCWILSIATIIAYKIYYDDPVGGLMESFSDILQIKVSQLKDLQRYFLDQIRFQAVITNEQFHIVLSKVIASK